MDTARTKLTKSYIDKVAPPPMGAFDKIHWDTELRGFGLKVTPKGKRTFIVQGRTDGKEARITIGSFGVFTVDQARDAAREHLRNMRMGVDPRAEARKHTALKITLREVATAYYEARQLKDSSKAEIERHVTTTFLAWLDKPIKDITRDKVTIRFREKRAQAPGQANQAFAILRALYNHAIHKYREDDGTPIFRDNPVDTLRGEWARLLPRDRRIPAGKVTAVWSFMQEARRNAHNRDTMASIDLVMFLMLTGARIGEASALTWDRVNLEEGSWHIPDPKNRHPVTLPLSTQAVDLLKTRQRVEGSPYVFASWGKAGHIIDPRDTMKRVAEVAGVERLSVHDLRRTFTSIGYGQCGIALDRIELLTNHVPKGVTLMHYAQTSNLVHLKPEVQQIADMIEGTPS